MGPNMEQVSECAAWLEWLAGVMEEHVGGTMRVYGENVASVRATAARIREMEEALADAESTIEHLIEHGVSAVAIQEHEGRKAYNAAMAAHQESEVRDGAE